MAGKSRKKKARAVEDEKALVARAQTTLRPSANAAAVIAEYGKPFGEQDVTELMVQLSQGTAALKENDLHRCEAMLFSQAHALQAIFMNLSRRAANQEYLKHFEAHLRLALKAQAQCVRTLEVLASIKNPPVVIAKQANIAGGHQQINNGSPAPTRPRENEILQNELLEHTHGERLDTRTTGAASGTDQAMAAMGEVHRAEVNGR